LHRLLAKYETCGRILMRDRSVEPEAETTELDEAPATGDAGFAER
jgi:hypothetical protein